MWGLYTEAERLQHSDEEEKENTFFPQNFTSFSQFFLLPDLKRFQIRPLDCLCHISRIHLIKSIIVSKVKAANHTVKQISWHHKVLF